MELSHGTRHLDPCHWEGHSREPSCSRRHRVRCSPPLSGCWKAIRWSDPVTWVGFHPFPGERQAVRGPFLSSSWEKMHRAGGFRQEGKVKKKTGDTWSPVCKSF